MKGFSGEANLTNEMNSRCQLDLIDMQCEQDQDFRLILNYQAHLKKSLCYENLKQRLLKKLLIIY